MSVKRPGSARRAIPARQRREIAARLRTFVTETLKLSRREFERRTGLPHATVAAWFAKGSQAPAVPDAAALVHLADVVQLNPAWLLLGDEPRVRGAPASSRSMAQGLRALVVGDLIGVLDREEAERLVPPASTLLSAFLQQMSLLREIGRAAGGSPRAVGAAPQPAPEREHSAGAVRPAAAVEDRPAPAARPPAAPEPQRSAVFEKVVL